MFGIGGSIPELPPQTQHLRRALTRRELLLE